LAEWHCGTVRWQLSTRLLDHVIVLNERHLKRLINVYVRYYHEDRTHLGLEKETPGQRPETKSACTVALSSLYRVLAVYIIVIISPPQKRVFSSALSRNGR